MKLSIQALEKKHERNSFDCGYDLLNDYLKRQARQDVTRDLSACFVLTGNDDVIKGYYTLSANSIPRNSFPEDMQKKMPQSYTDLPAILLGRLAVDNTLKGKGYGAILLMDALNRCVRTSESIGTLALIVDPIDDIARQFYGKYGFILLPVSGKMFLPMKTIKELLQ